MKSFIAFPPPEWLSLCKHRGALAMPMHHNLHWGLGISTHKLKLVKGKCRHMHWIEIGHNNMHAYGDHDHCVNHVTSVWLENVEAKCQGKVSFGI